jgi:hypothetical protein
VGPEFDEKEYSGRTVSRIVSLCEEPWKSFMPLPCNYPVLIIEDADDSGRAV